MTVERTEVAIIGAGISGLSAAKEYLQCAPDTNLIVLEINGSVGGTWAKERIYPGLRTNNLKGTIEYPSWPMHDGYGVKEGEHVPGDVLYRYLADYADHFDVTPRIRFHTKVTSATRIEDDSSPFKWRLKVETHGQSDKTTITSTIETQKLIVSTGLTSQPINFSIRGNDEFDAPIQAFSQAAVRLQDLSRSEEVHNITVVGGGKSAYDAVYHLATAGLHVHWVIRRSGYGPTVMAPSHLDIGPFKKTWLEPLATMRLMTWLTPNVWQKDYPWMKWFLHRTWLGKSLSRLVWHLMNRDTIEQSGLNSSPDLKVLKPDQNLMWYATSFAILNYPTNFHDLIKNGQVTVYREDLSHLSKHTVHLCDGQELPSEGGLVSTGWEHAPNLRFEPASIVGDLGIPGHGYTAEQRDFWSALDKQADKDIHKDIPLVSEAPPAPARPVSQLDGRMAFYEKQYRLYRLMVPPVLAAKGDRSLVFHGLYAYLLGLSLKEISGVWAYAWLNDKIDIPKDRDIPYEASLSARFLILRFPFGFGHSFPDFVFEGLGFSEMILRDLGVRSYRKKTWLAEIVEPYRPADYRGIASEWLSLQKQAPA